MPIKRKKQKLPESEKQLQRHLKSKIGGINSSNKAQLRKIQKLKIVDEKPPVPTSKFYMYINKQWIYKGLACRYCNSMMTDQLVIDKHQYICAVINKKREDD